MTENQGDESLALQKIELFSKLSNLELARLLGKLNKERYTPGETLFNQGDPGDRMYIIISGRIELYAASEGGERRLLAVLGEGDVLGEMALLTGETRSAAAVAAQPTELYSIDSPTLDQLLTDHPAISSYFIHQLSQRLVSTNNRLQAAKEEQASKLQEQLLQLPKQARELVVRCALLGSMPEALAQHAGLLAEGERLQEAALWLPWVSLGSGQSDALESSRLVFETERRQLVLELGKSLYGHQQLEDWLQEARTFYAHAGLWKELLLLYLDQEEWAAALELLGSHGLAAAPLPPQPAKGQSARLAGATTIARGASGARSVPWDDISLNGTGVERGAATELKPPRMELGAEPGMELGPELLRTLAALPAQQYAGRLSSLVAVLRSALEHDPDQGVSLLERVLESGEAAFAPPERLVLYSLGAELALKAGREQQAQRYLQRGEAAAASESELTSYGLSRLKLAMQRSQLLGAGAGRLLQGHRLMETFFVLLALACIVLFGWLEPVGGLSPEAMRFIGIAIAAVILWIINVIPDYLVALGMVMLWITGGLVTPEAALSGFGSTTWLYMIFIMAMSAVITKSGILYRLALNALKRFPPGYRGQLWGIIIGGLAMNPLIPSSSVKVSLGVPIARTLSESMGLADRSKGAAGFGLAAMIFYGFTAPFVLTGSYTNVMAYGLAGGKHPVSWLAWLVYAIPALAVFAAVMIALLLRMFGRTEALRPISPEVLDQQLGLLGPLSKLERIALLTVVSCILLMIAQPLHGVDSTWIMLGGFGVLIVTGALDRRTLSTGIDWTFLLFLGVAFSFAAAVEQLGIAEAMSGYLSGHMGVFAASPLLFLLAVIVLSFAVTLVIRDDPAVILLITALLPISTGLGIHPWVLVFVILLATDPFFFTYQSPTYLTAYYSSEGKAFSHRQGQQIALAYGAAVLLAVMVSIPFWHWLGLIR